MSWAPSWLPQVELVGKAQMPALNVGALREEPWHTRSLLEVRNSSDPTHLLVHGYLADMKLKGIWNRPDRYLARVSECSAFIAPDFSICKGMPEHERIRASWKSRAICSYFQAHHLVAIPNLRWAELSDLEFVLAGIPENSAVAVSTQSLISNRILRDTFVKGLEDVITQIKPRELVIYGEIPEELTESLTSIPRVFNFPTEISKRFSGVGA